MAKINIMGAALVAASVAFADGCDKCATPDGKEADGQETPAAEAAKAKDPAEAVITIDGVVLTRGELDAKAAKMLAAQGDEAVPADQQDAFKQYISSQLAQAYIYETVLAAKAKALGYTLSDEDVKAREADILKAIARGGNPDAPKTLDELLEKHPLGREAALEELRTGILIDKMLRGEVADKNTKDYTEETKKILDEIKEANDKVEAEANAALEKVKGFKATLDATPAEELDAKFQELAKENSDCPSKRNGGDLGEFTRGQMVPEFEEVAFAQDVGKVSEPVKTKFGWHLVLTTGKTPAVEATDDKPAAPEKVTARHILVKVQEKQEVPTGEQVAKFLKNQDERAQVAAFIEKAIRAAAITTAEDFKDILPPPETPEEEAPAAPEEKSAGAVETPAE